VKKNKITLLFTGLLFLFSSVFVSTSCLSYQGGSGTPSCHDDIAAQRTEPGTSPDCTPPILDEKKSREIIEGFEAKKIKGKWYIFLSAEEFSGKMDSTSKWKTISLLVSAVESMFAKQEECFLVQIPETEEDKDALLAGNYPQRLIAASATHVTLKDEEKEGKKWPEYHHQLFYTITVY
jgi:hypothetical protein